MNIVVGSMNPVTSLKTGVLYSEVQPCLSTYWAYWTVSDTGEEGRGEERLIEMAAGYGMCVISLTS